MSSEIRLLNQSLLNVLGNQPNVGFSVFSTRGEMLFCNDAAKVYFYGTQSFDPIGRTISEIEGEKFAAELVPLIKQVCSTKQSLTIEHIRFGRRLQSCGWPVRTSTHVSPDDADAILGMTTLARDDQEDGEPRLASTFASWGRLESLTNRELEVLAEIGRGLTQKAIADELGITRKTVETHRARIGQKLGVKSSTELARIACESGFRRSDVLLERQTPRPWMTHEALTPS